MIGAIFEQFELAESRKAVVERVSKHVLRRSAKRVGAEMLELRVAAIALIATILIIPCATAQQGVPLKLGKEAVGRHVPMHLSGRTYYGNSPDEHFVFMVEDALKSLGVPQDILVLSVSKLKNGLALQLPGRHKGQFVKILAFDEDELEVGNAGPEGRTNIAISLLTLAHEIGHHVCRHLGNRSGISSWDSELEADRIGGAVLARSAWREWFNASEPYELADFTIAASRVLGDEAGSASHPPLSNRLAAIKEGWESKTAAAVLGECKPHPAPPAAARNR